jgi:uncharacterized protein
VTKARRGFAVMDRDKQREIASKGGRAAHLKGTAHRWTEEEAKEAGRKGGAASHRNGHRTAVRVKDDAAEEFESANDGVGTEESSPGESTEETTTLRNGG